MNDVAQGTSMTVAEFYDALAPDYDTMTGFQKRFAQEKPFFRLLTERQNIRTALDAGCGTGFHSLLLAQLGVQMTGIDVSAAMIREAERHARELSIPTKFLKAENAALRDLVDSPFDAVFSLGNTTAHLLSDDDLRSTLESFHAVLRPKGTLFLQNLNYDRILATKERVQSIKEINGTTFVRIYDYKDQLISFNILTIGRDAGNVQQTMRSVQLRPILSSHIVEMLQQCSFGNIRLFGGISMDSYDPLTSKDLVVIAEREDANAMNGTAR
jgi:ubiquinone/menaquinone biosynthesis C-methylase UbiE